MQMTRFNITLSEGVGLVIFALKNMLGGEIFVPKIPSYSIKTVIKAFAPSSETKIIGLRPGEKLHEEMISETEALTTLDCGDVFVILPSISFNISFEDYQNLTMALLCRGVQIIVLIKTKNGKPFHHFVNVRKRTRAARRSL